MLRSGMSEACYCEKLLPVDPYALSLEVKSETSVVVLNASEDLELRKA